MIIIILHAFSDLFSMVNMSRTPSDCIKHLDVAQATVVVTYLRQLETQRDFNQTSSEVPDLCSPDKLSEFCDVYDQFLTRYVALTEASTKEEARPTARYTVQWLNRLIGVEHLVNTAVDGKVLYNFYFNEAHFITDDEDVSKHYLQLVASNVHYLILAELGQQKTSSRWESTTRCRPHPPGGGPTALGIGHVSLAKVGFHPGIPREDH